MDKFIQDLYASTNSTSESYQGLKAGTFKSSPEPLELGEQSLGDVFVSGLQSGVAGLGSSIDYFQSLVGTVIGADDYAEQNLKEAQRGEALASSALTGIDTFEDFLEEPTITGAFTQVAKFGGQGIPSLVYSIGSAATGGLGGAAVGVAAKTASKKAAERIVKDSLEKVAKGTATKADLDDAQLIFDYAKFAKYGALGGAAAAEYPSLAGENFGEALGAGQERNRSTALGAALTAVPQTVVGVGTEAAFLKMLTKKAKERSTGKNSIFGQLARNLATTAPRGAALEGFSEYAQSEIGIQRRRSYDPDYSQEEANLRRMESLFAGAVVGGFAGGAGSIGSTAYQNSASIAEKAGAVGSATSEKTQAIFDKAKKMWNDSVTKREFDAQDAEAETAAQQKSSPTEQTNIFDDDTQKEYEDLYQGKDEPVRRSMNINPANLNSEQETFREKIGARLAALAAADPDNTRLVALEEQFRNANTARKDEILSTLYQEKQTLENARNEGATPEQQEEILTQENMSESNEFRVVAEGKEKTDPTRTFDNTETSRAAFKEAFETEDNPIDFNDPFYQGMSESFLRSAVVQKAENPGLNLSFNKEGNNYVAVVPNASGTDGTFIQKTINKAKRSKQQFKTGAFFVDADVKTDAINLNDLAVAGVAMLRNRGQVTSYYDDKQQELYAAGLKTFLADMKINNPENDILIGNKSIFDLDSSIPISEQLDSGVIGARINGRNISVADLLTTNREVTIEELIETGLADPTLGSNDPVTFGEDESTRIREQPIFAEDGSLEQIPSTQINLELGPKSNRLKAPGKRTASGVTARTYPKVEFPFGKINDTVDAFVKKAGALIKSKKPIAIMSLSQINRMSLDELTAKFNDQDAAKFISKAAFELGLKENEGKLGEYIGFDNVHVVLLDDISVTNDLQTALVAVHEALGHVLYQEELNASLAKPELRKRLERDFEKARTAKNAPSQYQDEYGFEEWFADQVAIKAKQLYFESEKAKDSSVLEVDSKGVVARYFQRLVQKFRRFWNALDSELKRRFGKENASQAFSDYMDNHIIKERAKWAENTGMGSALRQISYKKKALVRSMEAAVDNKAQEGMKKAISGLGKIFDNAVGKRFLRVILAEDNILRGISPAIANMFYVQSNAEGMGSAVGFIKRKDHIKGQIFNSLEKMMGKDWNTPEVVKAFEAAWSDTATADFDINDPVQAKAKEIRMWLEKFYDNYLSETPGNTVGKRENYVPIALNLNAIRDNPDAFVQVILKSKPDADPKEVVAIVEKLVSHQISILNDEVEISFDATNPLTVVEQAREFTDGVSQEDLRPFLEDPEVALMRYIRQSVNRAEFLRATRDKDGNDLLAQELDKLNSEQREQAVAVIERYLGYTKTPMNPKLAKYQSYIQMFNWVTLLPLATIGSITELGGALVNTRELKGFEQITKAIKMNIENREQAIELARTIGVGWSTSMANLGLTDADAEFLDPTVRQWSDKFFQLTGLDWFTRFTREFAATTAVQFFLFNANPKTAGSRAARYLADHGVTAEQVNNWYANQDGKKHFTFDGEDGAAVKAGLQRFVENSMLRPNAAERPAWANNPHYQLIWALKSYLYSFGKVIMGGLKREAGKRMQEADNNWADQANAIAMTGVLAAASFMPLAMLSLELRELAKAAIAGILPGVDPSGRYFRSDRMSYGDYLTEIFGRAGFEGPLGIVSTAFKSQDWGATGAGALFGPTVGFVIDDVGMGLYRGKSWEIIPQRIIPGYNIVL